MWGKVWDHACICLRDVQVSVSVWQNCGTQPFFLLFNCDHLPWAATLLCASHTRWPPLPTHLLAPQGYLHLCQEPGVHDPLDPEYSILRQRLARRLRWVLWGGKCGAV